VTTKKDLVRQAAEQSLEAFIRLVHPNRVLGNVHSEVINWWERQDAKSHQLLLLPRDHQKSALIGYRVAHEITKNPAVRILYISSTSTLAVKQLKFIKDILTSDIYRYYWPEMVNVNPFDREKWTDTEIAVDHPIRKAENIRDATVFTAGLTTTITGLHCDINVFDDVVSPDNAYTETGRESVRATYSQLASIEGTDSQQWVVGTRYHPQDVYADMMEIAIDDYDEEGNLIGQYDLYEKFERAVENRGDGTGEFIWPRQQRKDGKWFGFNQKILATKRAQYLDKTQFRAQYYNDPNAIDDAPINPELFQYYDPYHIRHDGGAWFYKDRKLNVFAAIDFAYTLTKRADYTCLAVVGVDWERNYYVLALDRFQTDKISEYFEAILRNYDKYHFRKLRAECTAAQSVIVKDLKENYIRPYGLALSVDEFHPTNRQGSKEERVAGILHARYENRQIWHYRGGNTQVLEEELMSAHPAHDDVKDALASAVDIAIAPAKQSLTYMPEVSGFNNRFGGYG
jgi:hypothetical protein